MNTSTMLCAAVLSVASFGAIAAPAERAAVKAEAVIAVRAGLLQLQNSDAFDPFSAATQQAQARFDRMMNGPEYQAELRHQRDMSLQAATHDAAGQAAN
jgi:hypothetical protein